MIQEIYRALNFILVLLLCLIVCAIQSVVLKLSALSWLELDIILVVVVYLKIGRAHV